MVPPEEVVTHLLDRRGMQRSSLATGIDKEKHDSHNRNAKNPFSRPYWKEATIRTSDAYRIHWGKARPWLTTTRLSPQAIPPPQAIPRWSTEFHRSAFYRWRWIDVRMKSLPTPASNTAQYSTRNVFMQLSYLQVSWMPFIAFFEILGPRINNLC